MNLDKISLTNKEELETLSKYAGEKKEKMEKQSQECSEMGFFSLLGDSKFADVDNAFCNFFCLNISDKDTIATKIKVYQDFFEEVSKLLPENSSEEVNCQELRTKINLLKKKMSKEYKTAKSEVKQTSSYVICSIQKSFIEEYDRLNWFIRDVENAALSEMLSAAQDGWRKALEEIGALNGKLADMDGKLTDINGKYSDLCEKYEAMKKINETLKKKQTILMHQNEQLLNTVNEIKEYMKKQSQTRPTPQTETNSPNSTN